MKKITIELPEDLYREVKARAARDGTPVRVIVTEALRRYLASKGNVGKKEPSFMDGFGAFRDSREETDRIQAVIDEEFSKIDPEDWK